MSGSPDASTAPPSKPRTVSAPRRTQPPPSPGRSESVRRLRRRRNPVKVNVDIDGNKALRSLLRLVRELLSKR